MLAYTLKDKEKQILISKYNNTQKVIKFIDLLSLDSELIKIQKKLFDEEKIYLNLYTSGKFAKKKYTLDIIKDTV